MDASEHYRKTESKIWDDTTSKSMRVLIVVSYMLHVSAYSAMRVIPSAMLMYARPIVFGMWLGGLMFIFTAMKIWRGTYQYFMRMPSFISHLMNVLTFFFMSVGALFVMRMPYVNITGRGYTCFLLYGYIDAFAMLFAARALGEGDALFDDDIFNGLVYIISMRVHPLSSSESSNHVSWFKNMTGCGGRPLLQESISAAGYGKIICGMNGELTWMTIEPMLFLIRLFPDITSTIFA